MTKTKKSVWPKVTEGKHSTRIDHEDGTITFLTDWDKLAAEVSTAIEKHESNKSKTPIHPSLLKMSKVKLEEYARATFDIELDRRQSKEHMAEMLTEIASNKTKKELDNIANHRLGIKIDSRKPKDFILVKIFDTIK